MPGRVTLRFVLFLSLIAVLSSTPGYAVESRQATGADAAAPCGGTALQLMSSALHSDLRDGAAALSSDSKLVEGTDHFQFSGLAGNLAFDYAPNSDGFKLADVDGDGRADLIYVCAYCRNQIMVLRSIKDPVISVDDSGKVISDGSGFMPEEAWGTHSKGFNPSAPGFQMADFNGDGLADLVYESNGDRRIHVLLSDGARFLPDETSLRVGAYARSSGGFRVADVNGDGLPDLIYDTGGSLSKDVIYVMFRKKTGDGFEDPKACGRRTAEYQASSSGFRMADVNGDGLADFIYDDKDGYIHVLLSQGDGFAPDQPKGQGWGRRLKSYAKKSNGFRMADVNGDGRADFVYDDAEGDVHVLFSTGQGFTADSVTGVSHRLLPYHPSWPGGFRMVDMNGDGLADFVYAGGQNRQAQIMVKLSTGQSFASEDEEQNWLSLNTAVSRPGSGGFQLADVTGDGMPDLVYNIVPAYPGALNVGLAFTPRE